MSGQDSAENEDFAVRWAAVIGGPLPAGLSPERVTRSLRYAEQVAADPALPRIERDVNRRLKQLARQKAPVTPRRILPGTRLLREWGGATHDVLVTDQGYIYRGTTYRSLSAIAQIITGAHWSGPKFFGTA
jgi:hypothetical protein